jgi:hypothetical protein
MRPSEGWGPYLWVTIFSFSIPTCVSRLAHRLKMRKQEKSKTYRLNRTGCTHTHDTMLHTCVLSERTGTNCEHEPCLDVVDINLTLISELERALSIFLAERVRLVNFSILRKFTICFDCKTQTRHQGDSIYFENRDVRFRASSAVYLTITSALSSWKSRRESRMMSPWLIQT